MKRLNNKGFTLIEVLAVVVILGVLATIMVPTVSYIMKKNKEDNYNNVKQSILSAAKIYISDNRYNISLDRNTVCDSSDSTRNISKVGIYEITNNQIIVNYFIKNLSSNVIINPKDNTKLDKEHSYVEVKYSCSSRDYIFSDPYLVWK